jgi:hypothetical protein
VKPRHSASRDMRFSIPSCRRRAGRPAACSWPSSRCGCDPKAITASSIGVSLPASSGGGAPAPGA